MSEAQAQGQAAPAEASGATQEAQQDASQEERTFTQKDLNKAAGARAKEAEQRAINRILEQTGAESIDDVLSGFSEYQGIQEAVTTEADRANERAEKLEARAKTAEERYTNTLREFALRDSLRDAGINPERLKGAMRLADTSALEVDSEGNVSGLDEVVEAVREEAPEFFGASSEARPRVNAPQTNGTGVSTPSTNTDPKQSYANWLLEVMQQSS
jgi:hypothetical protein